MDDCNIRDFDSDELIDEIILRPLSDKHIILLREFLDEEYPVVVPDKDKPSIIDEIKEEIWKDRRDKFTMIEIDKRLTP